MFNLYQIVTGAQGGQALDNLAERFGLPREKADSAVKALMPALATAFMTKAMHPGGLQEIAGAMTDDHHKLAYADADVAAAPQTQDKGGGIAGSIFGNDEILGTVVREAARYTGVPEDKIRAMLPVIVSIAIGGAATAMHNQGIGGWLSQLANSGNVFGPGAGAGGMFGSILGNIFGGASTGAPASGPAPGAPSPGTPPWGGLPPAMQAGMDSLGKMFQAGVPPLGGSAMTDLGAQISSILSGKRG